MNSSILDNFNSLIPSSYINQAVEAKISIEKKFKMLIEKKKWPEEGWSEENIEMFLREISLMDSNNFLNICQVGEREGRVLSSIVSRRHFGFIHGIGRSGFLTEAQPKAAGSSVLLKLTNIMITDVLHQLGLRSIKSSIVIPLATGMTITLCLLTLKKLRPTAKYVLWSRIDQKSCIKSIIAAGLEISVIENILDEDELKTNLILLEETLLKLGTDNINCIITTTSCFAPRSPDKVTDVAIMCKKYNVPHVINNAYGLQSSKFTHNIQEAHRLGRVDLVIQSTDKNFLVPVGGSIVASVDQSLIDKISQIYPGRASASPTLDLFITLLQVGVKGYKDLLIKRKECFELLKCKLQVIAEKYGEHVLNSPNNNISIGMTLDKFETSSVTFIGSMLYKRLVTGTRVIKRGVKIELGNHTFDGFGSSCNNYPSNYLTAAASIGVKKEDIDLFISRLDQVLTKIKN